MKEFIVVTGEYGGSNESIEVIKYVKSNLNSSIIVQCHVLEGYRPVTEEEMKKYPKPECVISWNGGNFGSVGPGSWVDYPYFVPNDFKFEELKTDEKKKMKLIKYYEEHPEIYYEVGQECPVCEMRHEYALGLNERDMEIYRLQDEVKKKDIKIYCQCYEATKWFKCKCGLDICAQCGLHIKTEPER